MTLWMCFASWNCWNVLVKMIQDESPKMIPKRPRTASRLQPLQFQSGGGPLRQFSIHFLFFSSLLGLKLFFIAFCCSSLSMWRMNSLATSQKRCFEGNMTHLVKIGLYCVNILQYFNMKLQLNTPWFPDISLSAVVWLEITIPVGVWKNVQVTSCRTTTQLSIIFALDWSI